MAAISFKCVGFKIVAHFAYVFFKKRTCNNKMFYFYHHVVHGRHMRLRDSGLLRPPREFKAEARSKEGFSDS